MVSGKGRPLIFWTLLLLGWITVRAGYVGYYKQDHRPNLSIAKQTIFPDDKGEVAAPDWPMLGYSAIQHKFVIASHKGAPHSPEVLTMKPARTSQLWIRPALSTKMHMDPHPSYTANNADNKILSAQPINSGIGLRPIAAANIALPLFPPTPLRTDGQKRKRLEIYGYSFWRKGSGASALAAGSQYGGSQSAIIAAYRINNSDSNIVSAMARATISPGSKEREIALGLRWQPDSSLPVILSAERRFRQSAIDATAVYIAASQQDISLTQRIKISGYGQAGIVQQGGLRGEITPFVDATMRMERTIIQAGTSKFSFGAGSWAGGQTGVRRFDIGPTAKIDFPVGEAQLSVHADWRFRVAGNARPASGPALTVSSAF